jgi:hypothetical protein
MLDRARNPHRDVELGRHHLAGLADLPIVRRIAGIHRRARSADGGAQLVGHRLDVLGEVLPALHRPAAGNDDFCRSKLRPLRFRQFLADEGGNAWIGHRRHLLDRSRPALAGRLERGGAHRDDLDLVLRTHGLDRIAGIDQALERVGRDHFNDVGDLHDIEQGGDARHDVLAGRRGRRDDRVIAGREREDQRGHRLGQHVLVGGAVGEQDLLDAVELGGGLGDRPAPLAGDQHMHVGTERLRRGQRLVGGVLERLVVVLGQEERGHVDGSLRVPAASMDFIKSIPSHS